MRELHHAGATLAHHLGDPVLIAHKIARLGHERDHAQVRVCVGFTAITVDFERKRVGMARVRDVHKV